MSKHKRILIILLCLCVSSLAIYFVSSCSGKYSYEHKSEIFLEKYKMSKSGERYEMVDEIASISDREAISYLKKLLVHGDDDLKVAAILAIGNINDNNEIPLIRKYLSNQNSLIRIVSARALLKMGDDSGEKTLADILADEKSYCFEIPYVLEALSLDDSETSISSLIKYIESDRCMNIYDGEALISLGKIGGAEPTAFLIDYLDGTDKSDINRISAIKALWLTKLRDAETYLEKVANDPGEPLYIRSFIKSRDGSLPLRESKIDCGGTGTSVEQ